MVILREKGIGHAPPRLIAPAIVCGDYQHMRGRSTGAEVRRVLPDWSAALDTNAQTVIGNAASWVKSHPGNVAHVNGFADPTGSKAANALLSELRAQVVVDQLQSDGINPGQIQQTGHGSVQFALTSQESRRVEISISRP